MSAVQPGPCPPTGCPSPTQIDCIHVDKVYDFCSQTVTGSDVFCACRPCDCHIDLEHARCKVVKSVPSDVANFNDVTFAIDAPIILACQDHCCEQTHHLTTVASARVCNPVGTTVHCEVASGTCVCVEVPKDCGCAHDHHHHHGDGAARDGDGVHPHAHLHHAIHKHVKCVEVKCTASLCLLIRSTASVKLLVPTFGFCAPAPCETPGLPPCPPAAIFPPQCV